MNVKESEIRKAGAADAAAIAGLSCQLGYPTSAGQAEKRLAGILGSKEHAVFVALLDDQLVGFVHVFLAQRLESDPFAEVGGFVAAEPYRMRGIGRCLLAAAADWSIGCGCEKIRVRVRSDRTDARSFYRKLGFTKKKEQDVFDKSLQKNTLHSRSCDIGIDPEKMAMI